MSLPMLANELLMRVLFPDHDPELSLRVVCKEWYLIMPLAHVFNIPKHLKLDVVHAVCSFIHRLLTNYRPFLSHKWVYSGYPCCGSDHPAIERQIMYLEPSAMKSALCLLWSQSFFEPKYDIGKKNMINLALIARDGGTVTTRHMTKYQRITMYTICSCTNLTATRNGGDDGTRSKSVYTMKITSQF